MKFSFISEKKTQKNTHTKLGINRGERRKQCYECMKTTAPRPTHTKGLCNAMSTDNLLFANYFGNFLKFLIRWFIIVYITQLIISWVDVYWYVFCFSCYLQINVVRVEMWFKSSLRQNVSSFVLMFFFLSLFRVLTHCLWYLDSIILFSILHIYWFRKELTRFVPIF